MGKVISNILIGIVWLMYFFMICINLGSRFEYINTMMLLLASIVLFGVMFFNSEKIKNSKMVMLSSVFVIVYYVSLFLMSKKVISYDGMLLPIAFFVGVVISKIICYDKQNINKLVFALVTILTFVGLISIDIASYNLISAFLGLLIKITGIAVLTEFAVSICKDSGETAIASKIDMGGKVVIISMSIPIISGLLETIIKILP